MRLTILGSGTNIHPTRAAAGYLVRTDQTILLDFGPRTLMNLMKSGVNRHGITHILFSHYHADHFADFIPFFFDACLYSIPRRGQTGSHPDRAARHQGAVPDPLQTLPGFNTADSQWIQRGGRSSLLGSDARSFARTVAHSPPLPGVSD